LAPLLELALVLALAAVLGLVRTEEAAALAAAVVASTAR